jgi:hypothetical protein
MKRLFTLLFLLFFWAGSSWAVNVQIGSGTSTTNYFPIYSCYGYSYSQQIYLATEIQNAGGGAGPITKVRFYYSSGGTTYANWSNWTVYLGNTAKTNFTSTTDWVPVGSMTQVFLGNIPTPVAGTWLEISLPSAFNYTGGNLVVAVDENSTGYSCTAAWRSYASGSNRGILYYSDDTNPDPAAPPTANYGPNATLSQIQFDMAAYVPTLPPNCATIVSPLDLATNVLPSATLNWASGGGAPTGYKLYFGTNTPPTNIVNGTNLGNVNTYDPTPDMSYSTTYYWKIVAYNANGDATGCPVWSFATGPDPTIVTFPACESFDGTTFAPYGWKNVKTAGAGTPGIWDRRTAGTSPTCAPHSGAGMARYNSYSLSSGTKGILVTPPINFPADNYKVNFWMYRDAGYATTPDLVNVYYNTAADLTGTPALLGTINRAMGLAPVVAVAGWYQYEFLMPAGAGGNGRYVVFEGVSAIGNNIFLDDVCIDSYPVSSLGGYVYDYNGNPLSGATISKVGGISTTSGINGDYLITPLIEGSFQFKCSKAGYNDVIVTLDIPSGTAVTQNFTLTNPEMTITPPALYEILLPAGTSTTNLYINNDGNGPLGWQSSITSCDYTIALLDTYGDGWNNGKLDVLVNGIVVLNDITLSSGPGPVSFNFTITGNSQITTVFIPGSYPTEPFYYIYNSEGTQVWYSPPGSSSGPPNILPGQLFGYCDHWLTMDNYNGTVPPAGKDTLPVHFDANLTAGVPGIYTADMVFTSTPDVGTITVPATLAIADASLEPPTDLVLMLINESEGKFMLKWKYNPSRATSYFIVLRNGQLIGTMPNNAFIDILTAPGHYCYKVARVYDNGAVSVPSNTVCIDYPLIPGVPLSNWALVLAGLLIGAYAFIMIRRRS